MKLFIKQADGSFTLFLDTKDEISKKIEIIPSSEDQNRANIEIYKQIDDDYELLKAFELMPKAGKKNKDALGTIDLTAEFKDNLLEIKIQDRQSKAEINSTIELKESDNLPDYDLALDFLAGDIELDNPNETILGEDSLQEQVESELDEKKMPLDVFGEPVGDEFALEQLNSSVSDDDSPQPSDDNHESDETPNDDATEPEVDEFSIDDFSIDDISADEKLPNDDATEPEVDEFSIDDFSIDDISADEKLPNDDATEPEFDDFPNDDFSIDDSPQPSDETPEDFSYLPDEDLADSSNDANLGTLDKSASAENEVIKSKEKKSNIKKKKKKTKKDKPKKDKPKNRNPKKEAKEKKKAQKQQSKDLNQLVKKQKAEEKKLKARVIWPGVIALLILLVGSLIAFFVIKFVM